MQIILDILAECWRLLAEASIYIIFGLLVAGFAQGLFEPQLCFPQPGHGQCGPGVQGRVVGPAPAPVLLRGAARRGGPQASRRGPGRGGLFPGIHPRDRGGLHRPYLRPAGSGHGHRPAPGGHSNRPGHRPGHERAQGPARTARRPAGPHLSGGRLLRRGGLRPPRRMPITTPCFSA